MNPFAVHFSSITVSKLVLVGPDGYVAPEGAQLPINTAGFHIRKLKSLLACLVPADPVPFPPLRLSDPQGAPLDPGRRALPLAPRQGVVSLR